MTDSTYEIGYLDGLDGNRQASSIDLTQQQQMPDLPFDGRIDPDYKEYYSWAHEYLRQTSSASPLGLSETSIDYFNLGYEPHYKVGSQAYASEGEWRALIIPVTDNTYIARDIATGREELVGSYYGILNQNIIYQSETPVFIVKNAMDAISIKEAGGEAIALINDMNHLNIAWRLKNATTKVPLVVLALDNDERGHEVSNNIQKILADDSNTNILDVSHMYGTCKNARELFEKESGALEKIVNVATYAVTQEYRLNKELHESNKVSNHIKEFHAGIDKVAIPTGFPKLDQILEGGLYDGLYSIGAISSLGKTTYVMQMADQIAKSGRDVLIFSLEMSRQELMAKSISRLTYIDHLKNDTGNNNNKHGDEESVGNSQKVRSIISKKNYDQCSQEAKDIISKCITQYGEEYGEHLYIIEGVGSIGVEEVRKTIEMHISLGKEPPVVIIDYLQILAPNDVKASDKQNTDKAVLELKRMSRDYKIPVIGISSLNRQNYNNQISMEAFKESGSIEYSADVLLGMQFEGVTEKEFDVNKAKQASPRKVEVVVLKNRNGVPGKTIKYEFKAEFNYFEEIGFK